MKNAPCPNITRFDKSNDAKDGRDDYGHQLGSILSPNLGGCCKPQHKKDST